MAIKQKTVEIEQEKVKPWKNIAYFDNFNDASDKKTKLLSENDKIQVKVKRCGPNGVKYAVKLRKNPLFEEKVEKKGKKTRKNKKDRK
tara:strand:+ start:1661 stop:1924 length:264 start_codon:yes stop_codon:yes gene_type:complete